MADEVLREPHKTNFTAVRFSYGPALSRTVVGLTDWSANATLPGISGGFASEPSLEVILPQFTGIMKESPCRITVPNTVPLAAALVSGYLHPTVVCEVWCFTESTLVTGNNLLKFYSGIVTQATNNVGDKPGQVQISVTNLKGRLGVALGIPAVHHCIWQFNGFGCRRGASPIIPIGRIPSAISDNLITFGNIPNLTSYPKHRFVRGFAEYNGLRIGVRDFEPTTNLITLLQVPPDTWTTSTSITLHEGCDKELTTCRSLKQNEDYFGGFGHAMLARHPLMETH